MLTQLLDHRGHAVAREQLQALHARVRDPTLLGTEVLHGTQALNYPLVRHGLVVVVLIVQISDP